MAFGFTLWLCAGLYCRHVEAHLVARLRRASAAKASDAELLPLAAAGDVAPL